MLGRIAEVSFDESLQIHGMFSDCKAGKADIEVGIDIGDPCNITSSSSSHIILCSVMINPTMVSTMSSNGTEITVSDVEKAKPGEGNAWPLDFNSIPRTQRQRRFNELNLPFEVPNAIARTAGTVFLRWLRTIISVLFLAYVGEVELTGGTLAIGFANITGYSVLSGLAMGMEFLCGQAYEAKQLTLLGLILQRTVLVLLLAALPVGFLWTNLERIFLWCGQDEIIAKMAGVYITFSLPDLLAQAFLHPLRIYLTTQSITLPLTCCEAIALLLHIPINFLLVLYLHRRIAGVAVAAVWSSFNMLFSLVGYLFFSGLYKKSQGFLRYQGCLPFVSLIILVILFFSHVLLFYGIFIYATKYTFIMSFVCRVYNLAIL